ncbi:MAG: DUF202 domain-containing protein [Kineosporiaceae bacterium]
MSAARRPRSVYDEGTEPDPRFSMANERTALAWLRTALATVAGGVGLDSLARVADLTGLLRPVGALMCLLGGVLAASALLGWRRRERALRRQEPLPPPVALPWVAAAVLLVAVVLAVLVAVVG